MALVNSTIDTQKWAKRERGQTEPGFVALYDIRPGNTALRNLEFHAGKDDDDEPGNRAGLFFRHGAEGQYVSIAFSEWLQPQF